MGRDSSTQIIATTPRPFATLRVTGKEVRVTQVQHFWGKATMISKVRLKLYFKVARKFVYFLISSARFDPGLNIRLLRASLQSPNSNYKRGKIVLST